MSAGPHYTEAAPWVGGRGFVLRMVVLALTPAIYLAAWCVVMPIGAVWWLLRGRALSRD